MSEAGDRDSEPENLTERVKKWLDDSGFPLEMRVAREVRKFRPIYLAQEEKYIDSIAGVVRPVDVVASWSQLTKGRPIHTYISFKLAIECKTGNTPWIAFADAEDSHTGWVDYGFIMMASATPREGSGPEIVSHVLESVRKRKASLLSGDYSLCYALQQMKGSSIDRGREEKNDAYDALRQTASGAFGILDRLNPEGEPPECNFAMPILVTTHPLFEASLSEMGDVEVEPVGRVAVPVTLGSPGDNERHVLVHVVNEKMLEDLMFRISEVRDAFMDVPQQGPLSDGISSMGG